MKKTLVVLMLLLFLPVLAAGKTLPFSHESEEFIDKYNLGYDHDNTAIEEWDWLDSGAGGFSIEIIPNVILYVIIDTASGNIESMMGQVPIATNEIDLSKEPYIEFFLKPMIHRIFNVFSISNPVEVEQILTDLNFYRIYEPHEYQARVLMYDDLIISSMRILRSNAAIMFGITITE